MGMFTKKLSYSFQAYKNSVLNRTSGIRIENSIDRSKKKEIVTKLKRRFMDSTLAVNIRFRGLKVTDIDNFRVSLPSDSQFTVAKNSLIKIASNEVDGWSDFNQFAKSDSAILFIGGCFVDAIKVYETFVSKLDKSGDKILFEIQGGVLDGEVLTSALVMNLKALPSKKELIIHFAIMLTKIPIKSAMSIKTVHTKLTCVVKEITGLDTDLNKFLFELLKK